MDLQIGSQATVLYLVLITGVWGGYTRQISTVVTTTGMISATAAADDG